MLLWKSGIFESFPPDIHHSHRHTHINTYSHHTNKYRVTVTKESNKSAIAKKQLLCFHLLSGGSFDDGGYLLMPYERAHIPTAISMHAHGDRVVNCADVKTFSAFFEVRK